MEYPSGSSECSKQLCTQTCKSFSSVSSVHRSASSARSFCTAAEGSLGGAKSRSCRFCCCFSTACGVIPVTEAGCCSDVSEESAAQYQIGS